MLVLPRNPLETAQTRRLNVLVIGAGIGSLTAAVTLQQQGRELMAKTSYHRLVNAHILSRNTIGAHYQPKELMDAREHGDRVLKGPKDEKIQAIR